MCCPSAPLPTPGRADGRPSKARLSDAEAFDVVSELFIVNPRPSAPVPQFGKWLCWPGTALPKKATISLARIRILPGFRSALARYARGSAKAFDACGLCRMELGGAQPHTMPRTVPLKRGSC